MTALDAPPPPPLTMDSLEDLRAHLWKVHQVTVDPADPILMLHTIHRVALDEYRRLLDQHNRALSDQVRASAKSFTDDVRAEIEAFKAEALGAAVRERLAAMQEAARLADTAQDRFRRNIKLLTTLTVINFACVVFVLGVLTVLVR